MIEELNTTNTFATIAILISIASVLISIMSWSKSRAVYSIEKEDYFDKGTDTDNENILKKLNSGKYTILKTSDKKTSEGNGMDIILAKVRK